MTRVFARTSQYLPQQFPSLYRDEGPNFIEFVKAYYAWKETESVRLKSRRLLDYGDVDDTEASYLSHFVAKYMWGLPTNQVGDVRFLVKHVLDVYRSKGSVEGLRLLFRLLYDRDVNVYVPSKDMLAPSDATYVQMKYLELTDEPGNESLVQTRVYGWVSGATAIAESYVETSVRGRPVRILYLSNIVGEFLVDEKVYSDLVPAAVAPRILGSMVEFEQTETLANSAVGNRYDDARAYGTVKVSEISYIAGGEITFTLSFGGKGYTRSASITVVAGALLDSAGDFLMTEANEYLDAFLTGSGASFAIDEITNSEVLDVDATIILPYELDLLTAATFTYYPPLLTEDLFTVMTEDGYALLGEPSAGSTTNDATLISVWESVRPVTVGTISLISTTSKGSGYIDDATVIVEEQFIADLLIPDGLGGFYGADAVVLADVAPDAQSATDYKVESSGFGYYDGEELVLVYGGDEYLETQAGAPLTTEDGAKLVYGKDDSETLSGRVVIGAVGRMAGYWVDNDSMLNSNKVIQDSFYYQEHSYDVQTDFSLSEYERVLRSVYHPVGVELFGTTRAYLDNPERHVAASAVTLSPYP
jgi:hypothetical protein